MQSVLIVDDNKLILYALKRVLENSKKYKVYDMDSGRKALNFLKEDRPDIILLDLMMSEMDGWDVFKKIKEDKSTRKIPIIFITAANDKMIFDMAESKKIKKTDLEYTDHIQKPFTFKEVDDKIKKLLGG